MSLKLGHLDGGQHFKLADHLQAAQNALEEATRIVNRAPYTDATLRVMRAIQERLIDPLREEWDHHDWGGDNPYPSVNHAIH
jgi:hypothetical protein